MEKKDTQKGITIHNKDYPALLKQIKNAPKALYVKGDVEILTKPCIAIVGTRKASGQGMALAQEIAKELASAGLVIVSGLAQGIDGAAHKGALEGGGKTIGALASSLENHFFFPSQNFSLAQKMIEHGGALVSEYEKDTPALRHHFIARNRIVAGLSLGVLVIEAPQKSGALITAEFARDQKRLVFAVPGSVFVKNAQGTNALIKTGAHLIENAHDVLAILTQKKMFSPAKILQNHKEYTALSLSATKILTCISEGQNTIDKIIKNVNIDTSTLLSFLIELELQGIIKNAGAGNYIIIKKLKNPAV